MVSMATYIYTRIYTYTRIFPHLDSCAICTTIAVRICMQAAPRSFQGNSAHCVSNTVSYGRKEIAAYMKICCLAAKLEITLKFCKSFALSRFNIFIERMLVTYFFLDRNLAVNFYYVSLYYNLKRLLCSVQINK